MRCGTSLFHCRGCILFPNLQVGNDRLPGGFFIPCLQADIDIPVLTKGCNKLITLVLFVLIINLLMVHYVLIRVHDHGISDSLDQNPMEFLADHKFLHAFFRIVA